ncbi:ribosome maturation factor RimP [Ignatzschineria cameli]|uniref:Ribosome maturation factor RimP n=1 Tax=Ignatzschineria cameli TaxID=2182793 RepID=A0A2U2APQ9_9GAMM|nr:ribosome maturation factor RimP [Ignatzschineria cameli]PWD83388.1 ribosome maturation factor RimP [Ignatzschineria cameli]PWD85506.1 ribosome maturation factor RimP [Ignatzschineria cameli]PWD89180.1 ribosome maturation factor RimP [Ignatzschineria cameli]PWD90646.1 ribosome maturation factor RimP [Ignatzschineria cameli]PWD91350.1 ribosome maturation factor RimP [Ignatzschineria cameli]
MRKDPYNLSELLSPSIEALGYQLWGIEFHPNSKNAILRIYIDKEDGIGIEDCEIVSNQVAGLLDVHDPITMAYTLEVSSPGLDRYFFTPEQFAAYQNQLIAFQLRSAIDNRRRFQGKVVAVTESDLSVVIKLENDQFSDEPISVPLSNIDRAQLVIDF